MPYNAAMEVQELKVWAGRYLQHALPDLIAAYVFGSQARQRATPQSDLDLAVLLPDPLPALSCWQLAQQLAAELKLDVDLLDLRRTSTVMQAQVVAYGERLYCRDANLCAAFESRVYTDYARLNEERRAILEDTHSRGHIYAR
jgi:predicted nucleotidyltransferase